MLGSFDSEGASELPQQSNPEIVESHHARDIFEELSPTNEHEIVKTPELIPVHLDFTAVQSTKPKEKESEKSVSNTKDIWSEFESLEPEASKDQEEFLVDEFADLAVQSLHKPKPGPPKRPALPTNIPIHDTESAEVVEKDEEEEDPFDTSYVKQEHCETADVEPGDHIVFENDTNDLFSPIKEKAADISETVEFADPFDTTTVASVPPGKFELRILEEELLKAPEKPPVKLELEDDFDFDPRQGEKLPTPPEPEPELHPLDLIEPESAHISAKALTPQTDNSNSPAEIDPFDTSAVHISQAVLPGKLELQILESEFISQTTSNTAENPEDEFDFDPRQGEPKPPSPTPLIEKTAHDIFESEVIASAKPLLPSTATTEERPLQPAQTLQADEDIDPFDTSCVVVEFCGKAELKDLESELLNTTHDFQPPRPQLPPNFGTNVSIVRPAPEPQAAVPPPSPPSKRVPDAFEFELESPGHLEGHPAPLQPLSPSQLVGATAAYVDPFDTGIADSVIPGKIEIRLLESELGVQAGVKSLDSDPDFNPRGTQHPSIGLTHLPLLPQTQAQVAAPPPINPSIDTDDPFDTSGVDTGILGKAETKLLEAELL